MRKLKYFLCFPTFCLSCGVLFGWVYNYKNFEIGIFSAALIGLTLLLFIQKWFLRSVLFIVIGFVFITLRYAQIESVYSDAKQNFNSSVSNLEVITAPVRDGNDMEMLAENDQIPGKIQLTIPFDKDIKAGDILEGDFLLEEPPEIESFDYKTHLRIQNIYYQSEARFSRRIGHRDNFFSLISNLRQGVSGQVSLSVPEPHASLIKGLLWGEKASLPESFEDNLSRTGATHMIAVSGYNVNIVIASFLKLAPVFGRKRTLYLSSIFLTLFLVFVGLDNAPALRAGLMGYAVIASYLVGRPGALISLMSLVFSLMVLHNPLILLSVSFQLSFAATLGIILLNEYVEKLVKFLPRFLSGELATTLSAIIATTPITLHSFGTFSIVAPLVNMLLLPVVPLMMLLALLESGVVLISNRLGELALVAILPLFIYFVEIVGLFGRLSFAGTEIQNFGTSYVYTYYALLILFVAVLSIKKEAYETLG